MHEEKLRMTKAKQKCQKTHALPESIFFRKPKSQITFFTIYALAL